MHKITASDPESHSADLVATNIAKLKELFPEVVAEGKVDFNALKEILGNEVESGEEFYRFTWAGKAQARREAHKPSTGTLRPCPEESVDWDTTKNLYIEGDNLEVLKLLQKSYAGKVKMIYIDPPYNTGKDFVYKDNYHDNLRNYKELTGQVDSEGNTLSTNSDTDGRYHSNWLNMMYPRLRLARNLLKEDGVIFISIDDNELENLKKIGHEVFGESNFIGQWNWFKSATPPNLSTKIKKNIEFVLCYEKKKNTYRYRGVMKHSKSDDPIIKPQNSLKELRFAPGQLSINLPDQTFPAGTYGTQAYPNILLNDLVVRDKKNANEVIFKNRFIWTQENLWSELEKQTIVKINAKSLVISYKKADYSEEVPPNFIDKSVGVSTTESAGKYLGEIMGAKVFSYPKPVDLLLYLIGFLDLEDEIVMDFFSGSGTTAEAVFRGGNSNRWILVQLDQKIRPEEISDPSERQIAQNALNLLQGLKCETNLAELGKERIRRAGKKIVGELEAAIKALEAKAVRTEEEEQDLKEKKERLAKLDIGFRVFKLDSSNITAWDGDPERMQENLLSAAENIKPDRTEADVLYEVLLKYGLDLTLPIEERTIAKCTVYNVGMGALFLCLAERITNAVAEGIGQWKEELKPETCRVIFRDNGFTDVEKTNAMQTLKRYGVTEVRSV